MEKLPESGGKKAGLCGWGNLTGWEITHSIS